MGLFDSTKRAMKTMFSGRPQNKPMPEQKQRPSETATITRIRGIEFNESQITSISSAPKLPVVVMAFLDGRRIRGNIFNFSPLRDVCQFFPSGSKLGSSGERIDLKKLKAIFFLREQNDAAPTSCNLPTSTSSRLGRRVAVVFADNERLWGSTTGYGKDRLGFFLIPYDSTEKIQGVFVINANVKEVQLSGGSNLSVMDCA